jgi:hypothetical protein
MAFDLQEMAKALVVVQAQDWGMANWGILVV